jgi:hypothetical protein
LTRFVILSTMQSSLQKRIEVACANGHLKMNLSTNRTMVR